jgi:hypothetical protein
MRNMNEKGSFFANDRRDTNHFMNFLALHRHKTATCRNLDNLTLK